MFGKIPKIVCILLIVLLHSIMLQASQPPTRQIDQPIYTIETLPLELINKICSYIPSDDLSLNILARNTQLTTNLYDKIVEGYIDKAVPFFPRQEDILEIVQKHFTICHKKLDTIYQHNITQAFQRFIRLHPFSDLKNYLDQTELNRFWQAYHQAIQKENFFYLLDKGKTEQVAALSQINTFEQHATTKSIAKYIRLLQKTYNYLHQTKAVQLYIERIIVKSLNYLTRLTNTLAQASILKLATVLTACFFIVFWYKPASLNATLLGAAINVDTTVATSILIPSIAFGCSYAMHLLMPTASGTFLQLSNINWHRPNNLHAFNWHLNHKLSKLKTFHNLTNNI